MQLKCISSNFYVLMGETRNEQKVKLENHKEETALKT